MQHIISFSLMFLMMTTLAMTQIQLVSQLGSIKQVQISGNKQESSNWIKNAVSLNQYVKHINAKFSLEKLASSSKKDELSFQSLAEPLMEGQFNSQIPDFTTIPQCILTVIYCACVWSFCTNRRLKLALLITIGIKEARAATVPSFIYERSTSATPSNDFSEMTAEFFSEFSWVHASVIIGIIVMILMLVALGVMYNLYRKRRGTTILLEITNGHSCISIPVVKLPLCPSYWSI